MLGHMNCPHCHRWMSPGSSDCSRCGQLFNQDGTPLPREEQSISFRSKIEGNRPDPTKKLPIKTSLLYGFGLSIPVVLLTLMSSRGTTEVTAPVIIVLCLLLSAPWNLFFAFFCYALIVAIRCQGHFPCGSNEDGWSMIGYAAYAAIALGAHVNGFILSRKIRVPND